MYEKFYGLREKPFNVTPDPRFLYLGEHHQEALAHLLYGLQERKGFVVITGEVGTGKTTLIHTLLKKLDPNVKTALIFNPNLTLEDFFLLILDEFELKAPTAKKAHFLMTLNSFLIDQLEKGTTAVLIIDEAQNLSASILEEIRLLLNLETANQKLLQIILSGQPELHQKLNLPELRQLKQRISIRYHIPPLTRRETGEYITKRLSIAGSPNGSLFTDKAIDEIFTYSRGIPRLINILGDNSLVVGYADDRKTIDHAIVQECINDLELKHASVVREALPPRPALSNPFTIRAWRLAFMLFFLAVIVIGSSWWSKNTGIDLLPALPFIGAGAHDIPSSGTPARSFSLPAPAPAQRDDEKKLPPAGLSALRPSAAAPAIAASPLPEPEIRREPPMTAQPPVPAQPPSRSEIEAPVEYVPPQIPKDTVVKGPATSLPSYDTITVRKNDYLSSIILRKYGIFTDEILALVRKANPQVTDPDLIQIGWEILLPNLDHEDSWKPLYSVHLASFKKFDDAYSLFSDLVKRSYEAYLIPVNIPGMGHWYRITIGRFDSEKDAVLYADQLLTRRTFLYAHPIHIAETSAMAIEKLKRNNHE